MTAVLFGPRWPLTAKLAERAEAERQAFLRWIDELGLAPAQKTLMQTIVGMAELRELVDARCAVVSYPAEVSRRAALRERFSDVVGPLMTAGHLTAHPASTVGISGPGVVFRIRRPDVVLTVESAGPLWPQDAWTAMRAG